MLTITKQTKVYAPSNNDSKLQTHIRSNRQHLNDSNNSKNTNNHGKHNKMQAMCNSNSHAKNMQKLEIYGRDVEEAGGMWSNPWQSQGGIETSRKPKGRRATTRNVRNLGKASSQCQNVRIRGKRGKREKREKRGKTRKT